MTRDNVCFSDTFTARLVLSIFFILLIATSCAQLPMVRSTSHPMFSDMIGKKYRLKEDFMALHITSDKNYKHSIDYVLIMPFPGISGPEVIKKDILLKNAIIEISDVLTTKVGVVDSRTTYVIKVIGDERFKDKEVRVYSASSFKLYATSVLPSQAPLLNEIFFEQLRQ